MQEPIPDSEVDRIALRNMFKAIADYGRKVRLSKQEGTGGCTPAPSEVMEGEPHGSTKPRQRLRKRKGKL